VAASCETSTLDAKDCVQSEEITGSSLSPKHGNETTADLANLDLLRAVAVGLVFSEHITVMMKVRGLHGLGHFGVLLFFVHTSLVLMLSMGRLGLSGGRLYAAFMVRRVFRIYPLSILTVLLVVAFRVPSVPYWGGGFTWPGWPAIASNILLIQNITHSNDIPCVLWSLPFEVQMYAVLPLLYFLMRRFPSLWTATAIWLAGIAMAGLEYFERSGGLLWFFPCFLAGVFAWRLLTTQRRRVPGVLWIALLLVLVTLYRVEDVFRDYGPNWLAALHSAVSNDHRTWLPPYLDPVRDWIFCGITGLAIPFFAEIKNRWLNAVTRRIAQYSYGIYLCHVPMLWVCFSLLHLGNAIASAILTVFLTALVSFTLYHCVEHPGIQFGKHLATRLVNGNALKMRTV